MQGVRYFWAIGFMAICTPLVYEPKSASTFSCSTRRVTASAAASGWLLQSATTSFALYFLSPTGMPPAALTVSTQNW
jgi:hypothetical protein